ncbi:MAG: hypothetical protein AAGC55_25720, partial [Myxococcota bacterium]
IIVTTMRTTGLNWLVLSALAALLLPACEAVDELDDDGGVIGEEASFTTLYSRAPFSNCGGCHAPGAPGFVEGETESSLDWTTQETAYNSLQGVVSGLEATNFAGCNGAPFIGDTPETSIIVATFDEDIRLNFELSGFPDCNSDAISDMTLVVGRLPDDSLTMLKDWVTDGAPNN